jgi:hypothetical protein
MRTPRSTSVFRLRFATSSPALYCWRPSILRYYGFAPAFGSFNCSATPFLRALQEERVVDPGGVAS